MVRARGFFELWDRDARWNWRRGSRAFLISVLMGVVFHPALSRPAAALDINVTFAIALRQLAATAVEINQNKIRKDPLICKPRTTAANRLRIRTAWLHGKIILKGFGIEMLGVLEKVVARGGLSKTAEGLGLLKDAATADSVEDFMAKRGAKKLNKKLADKGLDKNARKKLVKELYASVKKNLKGKPIEVYREMEKGACVDGEEWLTVHLDLAKGLVIILLEATCSCNVPRNPRDPEVYRAIVVGTLKPKMIGRDVIWSFGYVRASFGGKCCGLAGNSYTDGPRSRGAISLPGGGQTAEEENPCDPVNCLQLEKEIEEDHDFLKKLKESLEELNSSGEGESGTATYLKESIASSQAGLRGKLLTWKDCCQNKAGPSGAFRSILMDWQLKRGVFARPTRDSRSSYLIPGERSSQSVGDDEERLAAIRRMMGELGETSGTSVQVPFGGQEEDLSAIARGEVKKRYSVLPSGRGGEVSQAGDDQQAEQSGGAETAQAGTSGAQAAESASVQSSGGGQSSSPLGSFAGALGQWRGDGGCGLEVMSLAQSGSRLVMKGAGPDVSLSVSGDEAAGQGAVLFGIANHRVRLRIKLEQIQMTGSNDSGGSCVSVFTRMQF